MLSFSRQLSLPFTRVELNVLNIYFSFLFGTSVIQSVRLSYRELLSDE